ncbi:hypothetical protein, partial [Streptomyces yanii]
ISLHHKRARRRTLRRGPLPLSDRLLVAILRHRWKAQVRTLTTLLGSPAGGAQAAPRVKGGPPRADRPPAS